jgi:hypothetical protein
MEVLYLKGKYIFREHRRIQFHSLYGATLRSYTLTPRNGRTFVYLLIYIGISRVYGDMAWSFISYYLSGYLAYEQSAHLGLSPLGNGEEPEEILLSLVSSPLIDLKVRELTKF